MRRLGIGALALGYGLSFAAVCLAACLMPAMVTDHACCAGEDGIRATDRDCCSVTPALSSGTSALAHAVPTTFADPLFAAAVVPPVSFAGPVAASASPPLVLRI